LQVEAAPIEGGREVELPVEEPLLLRDLHAALQPRRLLDERLDLHRAVEVEHHLDEIQLFPDAGAAESKLSLAWTTLLRAIVLHDLQRRAEDLLHRLEPL